MPHVVEPKIEGLPLVWEGEEWAFRVRGALISTTSLPVLKEQAKFYVRNGAEGEEGPPDEADFNRARIVFPQDKTGYIKTLLELLTEDNELDNLLKDAARLQYFPEKFRPNREAAYDLAVRHASARGGESEFVAGLVKDYLKPDANGVFGSWPQSLARRKLMEYPNNGFLGIREESAAKLRDHPTPCEELWKRITARNK